MDKKSSTPEKYKSLSEALARMNAPKPKHPLITVLNGIDNHLDIALPKETHTLSFYKISFRPNVGGSLKYGQTYFDFNEGGMLFAAPNQIIGNNELELNSEKDCISQQITLLFHPDFILKYPLCKTIKQYNYFSYGANEALYLSEEEKQVILSIFRIMEGELDSRIDEFSQDVMISQIELLLNYANRFYKRQFITRQAPNNDILLKLETILNEYFEKQKTVENGIPTVHYLADSLHMSPGYLSDLLRSLTGQSAQQHIHNKLIENAKVLLSTSSFSVAEIAYELGFEHSQSFNRLFKRKTDLTPLKFRTSFN
tara:strand:+ start:806 stop:1741 length:936 start_codon:yes stop_codon:yes gene_type:complete